MLILLVLFWILLNGRFTVEILLFGVAISSFIYMFMIKHLSFKPKNELTVIKNLPLLVKFFFLMIFEVFKSNYQVIKKILFLKEDEPSSLVSFTMEFKTELAQVVLANSITLTPGTITIKVKDNFYIVHGLSEEFTKDIKNSEMVKQIIKLEEKLDV